MMKRLMSTALSCSLLFSMQSSAQASIGRIDFTDGSFLHVMNYKDLPDMINILDDLIQNNQEKRPPAWVENTCGLVSAASVPAIISTAGATVLKKIISKSKGENPSMTPYLAACVASMALFPPAFVCQGAIYFLNRSLVYDANSLKSIRNKLVQYSKDPKESNNVFLCVIRNLQNDRAKNLNQKSAVYSVSPDSNCLYQKVSQIKCNLERESKDIKMKSFTTNSKAADVNQESSEKSQESNEQNKLFEGVRRKFEKG